MRCDYYDAGRCRSCTLIEQPYAVQLAGKEQRARQLLAHHTGLTWLPPVAGRESGFRTKAKMVVGGTVAAPTLGILDDAGRGVDLQGCGLYPEGLSAAFPVLASFVSRAGLTPYDVPARRGELKNVLATVSPDGELMVRFVLRSTEALPRVRKHLPWLLDELPELRVVSVNLLPEHRAVVEGDEEVVLTPQATLRMRLDDVTLHLRPQSFFQTNTAVAAALYRQAAAWVDEAAPATVWDLYCGVGGFALHVAGPPDGRREVTGIEVSAEAVASARTSAAERGLDRARFLAGDATAFALAATDVPDLVVVNPPRRGIGDALAGWLERSGVGTVVYSSCNVVSLARDLEAMPSLRPTRARLLDMFPQTHHDEVLVLLQRR
ncbi:23S rRNA (uracil(747)-C(5))-methyltransferase RlmC [Cellulomonas marina]|uniref:23S rRNA (Uracil747-C5)-methyltransferase n=1 Tax=Cellulomonas marina TaxID=988821 RepID=A0A1I0V349_9CELL|nr:23S rRNA (uracil(747)-C(5))-methyltransferase RlmC [Cellulomonas marina]GIG28298.1 23S rRNA (uracil(747)-C(5))-methyltransferase [Cellulomonas marina]SFA70711.1 23S rRNA (uracil747-C5)-methyltransferase [Cellulomonas marina]